MVVAHFKLTEIVVVSFKYNIVDWIYDFCLFFFSKRYWLEGVNEMVGIFGQVEFGIKEREI